MADDKTLAEMWRKLAVTTLVPLVNNKGFSYVTLPG